MLIVAPPGGVSPFCSQGHNRAGPRCERRLAPWVVWARKFPRGAAGEPLAERRPDGMDSRSRIDVGGAT